MGEGLIVEDGYILRVEDGKELSIDTGLVTLAPALLLRRETLVTGEPVEVLRLEHGERRALTHQEILDLLAVIDLVDSESEPSTTPRWW
jgi:hypothetical protein